VVNLESFEKDKDLEEQQKIDKALLVLCFLMFSLIGYLLSHYLLF